MPKVAPKLRPFCDDWQCPSLRSCARAWGRSEQYWRIDPDADRKEGVTTYRGPREAAHDHCIDYERDEPREWLKAGF